MELPAELQAAIQDEVGAVPPARLATVAAELSHRYRTGAAPGGGAKLGLGSAPKGGRFLQAAEDVAAYAAFRLPATFAAVSAALHQVQERLPAWSPASLLDVGAGPGTVMWAAASLWRQRLQQITLLERDEAMLALGKRLALHSPVAAVREANWRQADVLSTGALPVHDLVVTSYVLGELPPAQAASFVSRLWEATSNTLVIIEPGTPAGFARIKAARMQLLALGGLTLAPCPHDAACPLAAADWCHFSQRVARSRLHRQVKAGELSYEDEKFSFVAISRTAGAPIAGRVVRHPQIRPGHIHLDVCTPTGVSRRTVTRKDKEQFRLARDLEWGSALPPGGNGGGPSPGAGPGPGAADSNND